MEKREKGKRRKLRNGRWSPLADFDGGSAVMPAKAGIQGDSVFASSYPSWIPACAGMTWSWLALYLQCGGLGLLLLLVLSSVAGCNASLPEPESPAAQLYQTRCSVCHRLYAPGALTAEMWQFMLGRMDMEMQRRSVPLPPPQERATILEYLQKHASNASQ
jgi:hypothetical protein